MRSILALAGKDLREILRERSILASLAVQLAIAGFSAFLSVGLSGLYDPSSVGAFPESDVGYAGPGGFDGYLDGPRNINLVHLDAAAAREAWLDGRLDAVVEETYANGSAERTISLLMPDGTIEGTLLLTQMKDLLQEYERDLREARAGRLTQDLVEAPEAPRGGQSYAFVYTTLLPLLVLTPVFISGAIAGDSFVHEVQTRSLLILRSTPMSGAGLVAAKLLVPLLLAPLQVALWCGLLALNGTPVENLPLLLALAVVLTLLMASLSIALAAWVRHEGQVQAAYALVVLLLSVASLLLPHDPLNLVALLATGSVPTSAWWTLGLLAAAAGAAAGWGLPFTARRIRRDQT